MNSTGFTIVEKSRRMSNEIPRYRLHRHPLRLQLEWGLPVALVIGLAAFWHPLVKLRNQVGMDRRAKRLEKAGPHGEVKGNARIAHEALVYRRESK